MTTRLTLANLDTDIQWLQSRLAEKPPRSRKAAAIRNHLALLARIRAKLSGFPYCPACNEVLANHPDGSTHVVFGLGPEWVLLYHLCAKCNHRIERFPTSRGTRDKLDKVAARVTGPGWDRYARPLLIGSEDVQ